jgi:hypothetical protein
MPCSSETNQDQSPCCDYLWSFAERSIPHHRPAHARFSLRVKTSSERCHSFLTSTARSCPAVNYAEKRSCTRMRSFISTGSASWTQLVPRMQSTARRLHTIRCTSANMFLDSYYEPGLCSKFPALRRFRSRKHQYRTCREGAKVSPQQGHRRP